MFMRWWSLWCKTIVYLTGMFILLTGCEPENSSVNSTKNRSGEFNKEDTLELINKSSSASKPSKVISFKGIDLNYDGTAILVSNDDSGTYNLYRYSMDGAHQVALTHFKTKDAFGISWFPRDDRVLYFTEHQDSLQNRLYVLELDGSSKLLTTGDAVTTKFLRWSSDFYSFYVLSNERDPKSMDLYEYQVNGYQRRLVYQNEHEWTIGDVSGDGRWLALTKLVSKNDANIYLVDLAEKLHVKKMVVERQNSDGFSELTFSPDSSKLIFSIAQHDKLTQAWSYQLGDREKNLEYRAANEVVFLQYSKTGNFRVIGVSEGNSSRLHINETKDGESITLPSLPEGDLQEASFTADGKFMAFYMRSDTLPTNLFVYSFENNQFKALTSNM